MKAFLPEASQAILLTTKWYLEMFEEETTEYSVELTSLMLSEMQVVDEAALLLRRRASMASRIGFTSDSFS